jgi:3-hydroxyacyl-CoA dehydrogenase
MNPSSYSRHGNVAVITFGELPVNSLGHATRASLMQALEAAAAAEDIAAIVIVGNNAMFSGGADIREFGKPAAAASPTLHDILAWLDGSTKCVVAAIEGICLGGGLEIALACHGRVARANARLGLPEVRIGLLPGAGGTQRLPRLVGIETALEIIVKGEPVAAARLKDSGLLDAVVNGDPIEAAVATAAEAAAVTAPDPSGDRPRRTRDLLVDAGDAAAVCQATRAVLQQSAPHDRAALACVDAVEASLLPWDEGIARERALFLELLNSSESRALRHAFFAERAAAKIDDLPPDTPLREIARAAVIGGGTMGTGITMTCLNAGLPVKLLEVDQPALERGLERIRETYASRVARGRMTAEQQSQTLELLTSTLSYSDLAEADIVIEAVFEDMGVKETVFGQLDASMKRGAILATNTSTLDVDHIASCTQRPEDVIGTHFFSPAHVMRLLEVVRGAATAPEVLATVMQLARRIKKVAVVSGVCDGFIGNRMLHQYLKQAGYMLEEGASPEQVDGALEGFGMAMGPFRMGDLAGNDIGWAIRKRRYEEKKDFAYPSAGDRLCELGRFGQKTQAGWYDYEPGDRSARPSPIVAELLAEHRAALGIDVRAIDDAEIVDRTILALVNEGARLLEEGIAARASDIDVIYLTGFGFPRWRGGPMFYADEVGLRAVRDRIAEFAGLPHGDARFWKPAPLLGRLAEEGGTFNER